MNPNADLAWLWYSTWIGTDLNELNFENETTHANRVERSPNQEADDTREFNADFVLGVIWAYEVNLHRFTLIIIQMNMFYSHMRDGRTREWYNADDRLKW